MARTTLSLSATSPITGVALSMTPVISIPAGTTYTYVYKPGTSSTGRGAQVWVTVDGLNTIAANLVPLTVKWEDRAAVQGYVNAQSVLSVSGPIDIVFDASNDLTSTYFQFA